MRTGRCELGRLPAVIVGGKAAERVGEVRGEDAEELLDVEGGGVGGGLAAAGSDDAGCDCSGRAGPTLDLTRDAWNASIFVAARTAW